MLPRVFNAGIAAAVLLDQATLALMQAARKGASHGLGVLHNCVFKQLRQLITSLGASQLWMDPGAEVLGG